MLQTSDPPVHVVYDAMHLTLLKLMRRFVQADQLKDVHGSALQFVSYQGMKGHCLDSELVIGSIWHCNGRHQLLPRLVKSCFVLAQANANSERSLLVNARVVMKKKSKNQDLGSSGS